MTAPDFAYLAFYVVVLLAVTKPLGLFMTAVYEGRRTFLHPVVRPLERGIYRAAGIDESQEQGWKAYTAALLLFNLAGFLLLYAILRLQHYLPMNPQDLGGVKPSLAFNTAVSFMTNTNWQSYSGETTFSYFSQMAGLTFQNFVSAAVGMAVLVALIRGLARHSASTIGNFWVDLVRSVLYILLPLSLALAVFLVSQGVVQNFHSNLEMSFASVVSCSGVFVGSTARVSLAVLSEVLEVEGFELPPPQAAITGTLRATPPTVPARNRVRRDRVRPVMRLLQGNQARPLGVV
ncbi:MAG: potassium-transporting ATPase subunit KdpA [Chloroflexi bacterium]|nr:potassium-transporting ATPase subunit KdpA [Chloroflexota bacterium]